MGLLDKIKSNVEMWKIEKYTKRRPVASPEFEQKDKEFYREYYKDGVYLHQNQSGSTSPQQSQFSSSGIISTIGRKATLRRKSEKILRSSENYNTSTKIM